MISLGLILTSFEQPIINPNPTQAEIAAMYLPYQLLFVSMVVAYFVLAFVVANKTVKKVTHGERTKANAAEVAAVIIATSVAAKAFGKINKRK